MRDAHTSRFKIRVVDNPYPQLCKKIIPIRGAPFAHVCVLRHVFFFLVPLHFMRLEPGTRLLGLPLSSQYSALLYHPDSRCLGVESLLKGYLFLRPAPGSQGSCPCPTCLRTSCLSTQKLSSPSCLPGCSGFVRPGYPVGRGVVARFPRTPNMLSLPARLPLATFVA